MEIPSKSGNVILHIAIARREGESSGRAEPYQIVTRDDLVNKSDRFAPVAHGAALSEWRIRFPLASIRPQLHAFFGPLHVADVVVNLFVLPP